MSQQTNITMQEVIEHLGFDPYQASESVTSCASLDTGARAGCWCVFTTQPGVIPALYNQPNFVDAAYGSDGQTPGRSGLVYTFHSLKATGTARLSAAG